MSHIFISYSRRDLGIAEKIVTGLTNKGLKIWVDWNSIPKGEDWEQEIYRGIEEAEAFLFLVSPASVTSEMCNREIAHAVKNSKRIIPIFVADTDDRGMYAVTEQFLGKEQKQEIGRRNFIKCREGRDDIDTAIDEIERTIQTDYEWLKYQSRLQLKALEWERAKKDNSRLLRGKELREAEEKLAAVGEKTEPKPTELQNLYLISSKKHEKVVRRRVIAASVVATLVILVSAAWSTLTRERAIPGNWVTIPEGEFTMGMDQKEAETAHSLCMEGALESEKENCPSPEDLLAWSVLMENVELSTFRIMDNEVTNAQYQQCIESGTCNPPAEWKYEKDGTNKPATGLNWFEAGEYCTWLEGRLPTETEWEKAAGGPNGQNNYFPWGNTWDENKANLEQSGIGSAQSIVEYAGSDISGYGIKNLAGNVREWTASESTSLDESLASLNTVLHLEDKTIYYPVIVRGGAWINERSTGMSSIRGTDGTIMSRETLGFRCVCPPGKTCDSPWDWRWIWFGKY